MTREEQAIEHIKKYRELDEKLYNTAPKGTVSSIATKKCLEFWDMAISALEQQPCDDAISREDRLIDLANAIESDDSGYWTNKRISSVLRNIPSVTQKCEKCAMNGSGSKYCDNCGPKSGKWILLDECANSGYYCSNCQKKLVKEGWSNTVKKIKFCPNCGARMVEPQESEE